MWAEQGAVGLWLQAAMGLLAVAWSWLAGLVPSNLVAMC